MVCPKTNVTGFTESQKEMLKKAMKYVTPYTINVDIDKLTYGELLRYLSVFGNTRARVILDRCNRKEVNKIVLKTAEIVLRLAEEMSKDEVHTLMWASGKEKVMDALRKAFPERFDNEIDFECGQLDEVDRLCKMLNWKANEIERGITAMISTPEEAEAKKAEVEKAFGDFYQENVKTSILDKHHTYLVKMSMKIARTKALKLVDEKLLEKPIRLYYYRSGNHVAVKLDWGKNSYRYTVGRGKEIRLNRGKDSKEYPYIVSVNYIMDFLATNGVRDEDIWVDPRSVDVFYSFDGKVSASLTPSFVEQWWNYDCPDLSRHNPNKYRDTNLLGMPICHFTTTLVESTYSEDYVDSSITEEEFKALTRGREETRLYKTIKNVFEAQRETGIELYAHTVLD